ncbi:MAG TPA: DUF1778 domain-containing protein [Cyclobacteriaceae bacterium]|nr:DUF1778 domain-containing protein [Cyclobacteriaceae bacterium]
MNLRQAGKDERIEIRVSPEDKGTFQRAHELSGERTFSAFIISVLKDKSKEIIEKNNRILATDRDREIFFESIFTEQQPNKTLREAADKYKKRIRR